MLLLVLSPSRPPPSSSGLSDGLRTLLPSPALLPTHPLLPHLSVTQVRMVLTSGSRVNHKWPEPVLLAVVGFRMGYRPSFPQYCEGRFVQEILRNIL